MTNATATKLHYDIVGSFLRPDNLKQARAAQKDGKISLADLHQVEDQAIKDLVAKEKAHGLKIVTDGEFRRSYWHLDTFWGFNGIKHTHAKQGYLFHDEETRNDSAQVAGRISFNPNHPDLAAYKFLYDLTKDDPKITARQSIPAPAQFYAELVRGEENVQALKKVYDSTEDLINDIGEAYRSLILALYAAGCRDVKIDDCTWGMVVDDKFWETMANGDYSREKLEQTYLEANNAALHDLPDDLRISTHVCRGNYHSTWAASGGYDPVADYLFAKENVQAFYLEFDDDRSGDFAPLAKVATGKDVVLGLVTSKRPELEDPQVLIKRVKEASQYVPLEHLSLSTQCGFASTEEGNKLTEKQQWDKIELVVATAEKIWN
ncbi:5-methyltetrahydropteroyltriglutamate--homocysteine s-methyltransferase [Liquorilactobacillus ghanensis DSM 18630]|jgi:methionine synthase II (cobalamin-independent)|uniref:5-methyltetrahydropteroyltriglutamate--homocysteine s-methyltransferase n=1 Tax=Liquorilactobacillus ghanensis DSM 18630 TaxID=1423750 RepID=A0A0R1VKU4_9LACO|nr:5-methyltetrahydropteroyltriglutamate--homocysteine S-methyltransferase [Liquorilactobacillus ghanensis]KRM06199.1 5-methyltetrahydropteroyltriglutamate--homocysteine s-methyltransferase [Liquorilactobacillus ghanensis DSM 18630]